MIPDYQTLMLPVLKSCAQGRVAIRDVIEQLADDLGLSEEERNRQVSSGTKTIFSDRVHWAKTYLKQAGLLLYPVWGQFEITDAGREVLAGHPDHIDKKLLEQFDSFRDFQRRQNERSDNSVPLRAGDSESVATPDEILHSAYQDIRDALAAELLDRVRNATPQFFEELIVTLLLAMGYGGASEGAGRAIGKSGDNGVDGVIDQDPLGVDQVYVQAKRYGQGNDIGAGAIRDFYGALSLKKA